MSRSLSALVRRTIREHALVSPGDRIAVALSGGPDSVALVLLLRDLERAGDLDGALVGVIHVNHGLRGEEASRDERFCRALADRLGLAIESAVFDVGAAARAAGRSIEATARDVRYQFFGEAAARLGATLVATGHTLDDQAETVLLRLLRGTGTRGLSGIRVRRDAFIRPLLTCRRADLRAHLASRGEAFCEDSSNQTLTIARNRVRHVLLPVVEQIAPGALAALSRCAELAAADEIYLEQAAAIAARSVVREEAPAARARTASPRAPERERAAAGPREQPIEEDERNLRPACHVQLDSGALAALPDALARRVIRQVLERVVGGRGLASVHLAAVLQLARAARPSGHLDLPGASVERDGRAILIEFAPGRTKRRVVGSNFEVPLPVPGAAMLPGLGWSIAAWRQESATPAEIARGPADVVVLQADAVAAPLTVRTREPGDRLRPLGAPGRRKLQDLFVDRKVRRSERDHVPIVVDAAGRIVWVVGVAIAEGCRVTAPSGGVVILEARRDDRRTERVSPAASD